MYLSQLSIQSFRKIRAATLQFQPGLNVIVGPNNIGKTAVIDALRALFTGSDEPYPRFTQDDVHISADIEPAHEIRFDYVFSNLSFDEEADFLHAIREGADGQIEAVFRVVYGDADRSGRLKPRRWCGEFAEISMSSSMLENLRSVYLQPLRDVEQGLRPGRNSQLSRLLHLLSDDDGRASMIESLKKLDLDLKSQRPIQETHNAIRDRHVSMLGPVLAQAVEVGLAGSDFAKLASRLSLLVDTFEIERNGLGYNNLIYMAVVLSELSKNSDAAFRSLIVEEPEAHLHPQLQAILLQYLSSINNEQDDEVENSSEEKPVQVFVTSHSPNFASIADLDSIVCIVDADGKATPFHPRFVRFEKGKREKLARYLDVTRAELFFARRALLVEGMAELLLVSVLAQRHSYDLREHAVSLISVEGLNFDSFMPLFGEEAIQILVSVITDADPKSFENQQIKPLYPAVDDLVTPSETAKSMLALQDRFVKVFHGQKTFEYDLALIAENRPTMLAALKEIHPQIGIGLEAEVAAAVENQAKAKTLFRGMFERQSNNVSKGRFAQALSSKIQDEGLPFAAPRYILDAIEHVCR